MPIVFAEDFDYSSLKHVTVRSRKNREVELPPMPTAEEVERWRNRELRFGKKIDFQPNYADGVEARRDAEKARRDEAARKRLQRKPVTLVEELSAVRVRAERPATSQQKIIAAVIHAAPQELSWSHTLSVMPASEMLAMAKRCSLTSDPVLAWNMSVQMIEPRIPGAIRHGHTAAFIDPNRPSNHAMGTLGFYKKPSQNDMVSEWMRAAEEDRLANRRTRCAVTGKSLVIKTNYFGRHSWSLAPAFHGMSVEAAQQIASAVAIKTGIVGGVVRGTPPPMVERLMKNPQDWLGLVVATKHPTFYAVASELVKYSAEALRFTEDKQRNRDEWNKFASTLLVNNGSIRSAG
jgi:hypothetical protein